MKAVGRSAMRWWEWLCLAIAVMTIAARLLGFGV